MLIQILPHLQQIRAAYQLIHSPHAQSGHVFPQFPGNKSHEILHILRLASEMFPKLRILGSYAHRTGVQVADPHHDASQRHQGRCGKAEFLRPQDGGDGHVPAAHQLAVRLNAHLVPEPVLNQCLMGLRQAQFPGQARIVDGTPGRCACPSVVAGYQNHLGTGFGHTGRHSPHARFRH